jgi:hypothetical protein
MQLESAIGKLNDIKKEYISKNYGQSTKFSSENIINDNSFTIKFINDTINKMENLKNQITPVNVKKSSNASKLISVLGAQITCSFGAGPGSYIGSRLKTMPGGKPGSNISDSKLGLNLLPFSGCISPTNPFFKPPFLVPPLPCIPQVTSFIPTSPTIFLEDLPITTIQSKGICTFAPGGIISFSNSGQNKAKAG